MTFSKPTKNTLKQTDVLTVFDSLSSPMMVVKTAKEVDSFLAFEITYINPAFNQQYGFTESQFKTLNDWVKFCEAVDKEAVLQNWQQAFDRLQAGKSFASLNQMIKTQKMGIIHSRIELQKNTLLSDDLVVLSMGTIECDVLMKSQLNERLKELQELAQVGSWDVDLMNGKVFWSDQMYKLMGEDPDNYEPNMEKFYPRMSDLDAQRVSSVIAKGIETGTSQSVIVDMKKGDGSFITLEIHGRGAYDAEGNPVRLLGSSMDISHRVSLEAQNRELANLIKVAQQEIFIVDIETDQFVYVNQSACDNTGYTETELLSMNVFDLNPKLRDNYVELHKFNGDVQSFTGKSQHRRKDGSFYEVEAFIQKTVFDGRPCFAIFDADVSKLREAETELQKQFDLLQYILDAVPVSIYWKDREGQYLGANKLFLKDLGFESQYELIGQSDFEISAAKIHAAQERQDDLNIMLSGEAKLHFEETRLNDDGHSSIIRKSKLPMKNSAGDITGILGSYEDITTQVRIEKTLEEKQKELQHRANYDELTGLPNRWFLQDRIQHLIAKYQISKQSFAMLLIDLDQFKQINDSMGHDTGDLVLNMIAARLETILEPNQVLGRLGGDEFTILLENVSSTEQVGELAQKINAITKESINVGEQTYFLSSSVGISLFPQDAKNSENLLKCADAAMYSAKDSGRDNHQFYSQEMTDLALDQLSMKNRICKAIAEREFIPYFQPQLDVETHTLIGMEALVRWQDSSLGMVMPGRFIPVAEELGVISDLDRIVIQKAMQTWVNWYQEGLEPGILSVNVSAQNIQKKDFIHFLKQQFELTGFKPRWLNIELTESDVMKNLDEVNQTMQALAQLGIGIAIDDFGTGYSSLAYLKRLPVNKLKIDQSFVKDLDVDDEDQAIATTIINMALNLGMGVIAEGVENQYQIDFLLESGCYECQGFYLSKPLAQADAQAFIEKLVDKAIELE